MRSICIPSHRPYETSARSIQSALNYAQVKADVEVVISDNSGDPLKKKKLEAVEQEKYIYSNKPGLNVSDNWANALDRSSGQYVAFLADDDQLVSVGNCDPTQSDPLIAGYRPNVIVWEKENGIVKSSNFEIVGQTASDRIVQYFEKAQGNNNTLFSFFRRQNLETINGLCANHHPMSCAGYYDWAVVLAHLSRGNLLNDKSSVYIYDNHNWAGDAQNVNHELTRLFESAGVSQRARLFLSLFIGLDSFILINAADSPIIASEKIEAAGTAMLAYTQNFVNSFHANTSEFTLSESKAIQSSKPLTDLPSILNWALSIVDAFDASLTSKYESFYQAAIEKQWGTI